MTMPFAPAHKNFSTRGCTDDGYLTDDVPIFQSSVHSGFHRARERSHQLRPQIPLEKFIGFFFISTQYLTSILCLALNFSPSDKMVERMETGRRVTKPSQDTTGSWQTWSGLPLLVQVRILESLGNDYDRNPAEDKRHRAAYATVCLQWQEYFERRHFRKLVLHQSDLDDFQKIIQRRVDVGPSEVRGGSRPSKRRKTTVELEPQVRRYMPRIRRIWLRVHLLEYDCKTCKEPESGKERVRFVLPQYLSSGTCCETDALE